MASVAALEASVASGYIAVDCTASITNADYASSDGWSVRKTNGSRYTSSIAYSDNVAEIWNSTGEYYQTVTGLAEGLYKVTANAFSRCTNLDYFTSNTDLIDVASVTGHLYANTSEDENISSLGFYDDYSDYASVNNKANVYSAISADETAWLQTLYVYVPADGSLTLGFVADGYTEYAWNVVANWTLTRIEATDPIEVEITSGGYATLYYSDRNLQVPEGVTAYVVASEDSVTFEGGNDDETGYLCLTEIESGVIPAGEAVVLNAQAGTYSFAAVMDADAVDGNILSGTDTAYVETSDNDYYYVLGYDEDESYMGFFYSYEGGHKLSVGAHHAYLQLEASEASEVKGFRFSTGSDDTATAISAIAGDEDSQAIEGIYTLQGIRLSGNVESLPGGLYIINGKKAYIK